MKEGEGVMARRSSSQEVRREGRRTGSPGRIKGRSGTDPESKGDKRKIRAGKDEDFESVREDTPGQSGLHGRNRIGCNGRFL
jgi:hypothetical protein